jgi:hypothetical protein
MPVAPTMRRDLHLGSTWSLPPWSSGPTGGEPEVLDAARAAGYQGVQGADAAACRALGLVPTTFDICIEPGGLADRAVRWSDEGFACCTIMLGTGMEDDDEASRLIEAVLDASARARFPLYVETHRATVTQDIWRTLRFIERFPELRFNADLSHWYTGHDLPIGDFPAKVEAMAPVLDRVRYLHGRIATSGCIQVDVGDGDPAGAPSVPHFQTLWTRAFEGFVATVADDPVSPEGSQIGFAPELLPPEFGYARLVPGPDGAVREEGDRWSQALVLTELAEACFADALARSADG